MWSPVIRTGRPLGLALAAVLGGLLLAPPAAAGDGFQRATGYEKPARESRPGHTARPRRGLRSGPYSVHTHHNYRRRGSSHRRYVRRHDDPRRYPARRICRDIVILSSDGRRAFAGSTCGRLHDVAVLRDGRRLFLVPD